MTEDEKLLSDLLHWMDCPQQHLNEQTRRHSLDTILIRHFDKVRANAAKKERAAARQERVGMLTMWGGVIGLIMTLFLNSSKILEIVGWFNAGT